MRMRALALAPLLLLGACDFFLDPDPYRGYGGGPAAVLTVQLAWTEQPGTPGEASLTANAQLYPGADGRGERGVVRDTLWVAGRPTRPRDTGYGALEYAVEVPGDELPRADSLLAVVPPEVEGLTPTPAVLRFALWRRAAPGEVALQPGADLVLELDAPDTAPPQVTWTLSVGSAAGSLSLNGSGPPPRSFRVPRESLPGGGAAGPYHVQLGIGTSFSDPVYPQTRGRYSVQGFMHSTLRWLVTVP